MNRKARYLMLVAIVVFIALSYLVYLSENQAVPGAEKGSSSIITERPIRTVRIGVLPYLDHTYAYIAKEKGWFEEVGLNVELVELEIDRVVPALLSKNVNVASVPPGILIGAWSNTRKLKTFVFGNLFAGYAIMAQPDADIASYSEYRQDGLAPADAARRAIQQMRGKSFAYPPDDALRPFISVSLKKGGLTLADIRTAVMDVPLTVRALKDDNVDFQTGGAPSRIELQGLGFIPMFTSADLLELGEPRRDSEELVGVLQSGWAAPDSYIRAHPDVILKLAQINYRIMEAIYKNGGEGREIHIDRLSQLTQTNYSEQQIDTLYDINDFRTFEQQSDWFENEESTEYYKYINGAIIEWFERDGVFAESAKPKVDDIICADNVWFELNRLRSKVLNQLRNLESENKSDLRERVDYLFKNWRILDSLNLLAREKIIEPIEIKLSCDME